MYEIGSAKPARPRRETGAAPAAALRVLRTSPGPPSPYPIDSRRHGPFLARDGSGPYRTFPEDLRQFISLRLDRVDPYRESAEYCRQQEEASRLYERLREALPEEGQALLLQYSEALGAAHCLEVEIMAEKAFMDGMRIAIGALTDESNVEF